MLGGRGNFKAFGESLGGTNVKIDGIASDVSVLKADMADVKARMTRVEQKLNGEGRSKRKK